MKRITLLAGLATILSTNAIAAPMPANRAEAQYVASYIDQNAAAKGLNCNSERNETKRTNCAYGIGAIAIDNAMKAAGYSYKDTLHKIAQDKTMLGYMSAGLGDFLTPVNMLKNPEGQEFMVKNGLVNRSDIAELNNILSGKTGPDVSQIEGLRRQQPKQTSDYDGCIAAITVQEKMRNPDVNPDTARATAETKCASRKK